MSLKNDTLLLAVTRVCEVSFLSIYIHIHSIVLPKRPPKNFQLALCLQKRLALCLQSYRCMFAKDFSKVIQCITRYACISKLQTFIESRYMTRVNGNFQMDLKRWNQTKTNQTYFLRKGETKLGPINPYDFEKKWNQANQSKTYNWRFSPNQPQKT